MTIPSQNSASAVTMRPMRILVVDDEPAVRRTLERALRLDGYEVESSQDGLDALDRLAYREWAFQAPEDRVALGQAALLAGADPKKVLDRFLDREVKAS